MPLLSDFSRWLRGSFTCVKCGREVQLLTFGYGSVICPDCYNGEGNSLFLDDRFLLNRLLLRSLNKKGTYKEEFLEDLSLDYPHVGDVEVKV